VNEPLGHAPMLMVPGATREAFRTSLVVALVVGVLGLVAGALLGQAPLAAFGCFGLVLGAANSLWSSGRSCASRRRTCRARPR
jgi:hypothetical protein